MRKALWGRIPSERRINSDGGAVRRFAGKEYIGRTPDDEGLARKINATPSAVAGESTALEAYLGMGDRLRYADPPRAHQ